MIDRSPIYGFRFLCRTCLEVDKVEVTYDGDRETITCECGNTETRTIAFCRKCTVDHAL